MAPIRIGLIGLSATGGWAQSAHLPYLRKSSKYTITALCNSSVDSAKAAIKAHGLPDSVHAHGSPEELAKDTDVDLVVCSTRVDKHHPLLMPILAAGKNVYCEWPLGHDLASATEMANLAKEKGIKGMIGLQIAPDPKIAKIKELIQSGAIGEVLSSSWVGFGYNGGPREWVGIDYFNDPKVGGNLVTIHFTHLMAGIFDALGPLKSYTSILDTKRKTVQLMSKPLTDPSTEVVRTVERNTPDQILVQGHFESSALFSLHMRGGRAFPGRAEVEWSIYGSKGEIKVIAGGPALQVGYPETKVLLQRDPEGKGGEAEEVKWTKDQWEALPQAAQNVARLYEAFADGQKSEYKDFEEALVLHKFVDEVFEMQKEGPEKDAQYNK